MSTQMHGSDATRIYRETSGTNVLRLDRTADGGSLLDYMKDASIRLGTPGQQLGIAREKIPESPLGSVDAYFSR